MKEEGPHVKEELGKAREWVLPSRLSEGEALSISLFQPTEADFRLLAPRTVGEICVGGALSQQPQGGNSWSSASRAAACGFSPLLWPLSASVMSLGNTERQFKGAEVFPTSLFL